MNPTIDKVTREVQHVIATLEVLHEAPVSATRSLRMAIALLHEVLDALDAVRVEASA